MKRNAGAFLILALATVAIAGAAEAGMAANSNAVETPLPQLSANPGTKPEVPMAREPQPPAAPPATPPVAAQPRNTWWMILAVLAVLTGRPLLKRLRSRSGPS